MLRALLVVLIAVCPGAVAQQGIALTCNATHCAVPIEVLKALVAQSRLNCGPPR